jgi:hypothetical protein
MCSNRLSSLFKQQLNIHRMEPAYQGLFRHITARGAFVTVATAVQRGFRKSAPIFLLFVALVAGNLISVHDAYAQQTPIFWSDGTRWDYFGFINEVRRNVNGYDNRVPGVEGNTVDHTDVMANHQFFDVVIGTHTGQQVRIRVRASDLYIVGWFTRYDVYNYVGARWEVGIPRDHDQPNRGGWGGNWQLTNSGNYGGLERMGGGINRARLRYDSFHVNAFAMDLWNASDPARMAAAVVYFAQFISEAARFRSISDSIGWNGFADRREDNWRMSAVLDINLVRQENQWGTLSERFNTMLENGRREDNPRSALYAWYRGYDNVVRGALLITLADYAKVMNTVLGYPRRR